jgi:cytochrome c biogenesis protein CcdA
MVATRLNITANKPLTTAGKKQGIGGDILLGAALGPVFSSCSPTYALIVATILPVSFGQGLLYLAAYSAGLGATLLLIAYAGQQVTAKMQWLANPNGWLRRVVGVIFIIVGIAVTTGLDKQVQAFVLQQGWYDPISQVERWLRP